MRKLALDLGTIKVESFFTGGENGARGTVKGRETEIATLFQQTCENTNCGPFCVAPSGLCVYGGGSAYQTAHTGCNQNTCGNYTCADSCPYQNGTCNANTCQAWCTVPPSTPGAC